MKRILIDLFLIGLITGIIPALISGIIFQILGL